MEPKNILTVTELKQNSINSFDASKYLSQETIYGSSLEKTLNDKVLIKAEPSQLFKDYNSAFGKGLRIKIQKLQSKLSASEVETLTNTGKIDINKGLKLNENIVVFHLGSNLGYLFLSLQGLKNTFAKVEKVLDKTTK